jgi:predicted nuclease of predicted toxin-antitoxin system
MKLLIDNALSPVLAERLRAEGHDVVHVRDLGLADATDAMIMDAAAADSRALISADTDFGTLLARRGAARPSVVLLRRSSQRKPELQAALLLANLPAIESALEVGAVVVIEDDRIRVRALPFGGEG